MYNDQHSSASVRRLLLGVLFIAAIIIADQYTKWFVMETMLRAQDAPAPDFMTWFFTIKKIAFFENEREAFKSVTVAPWLNLVMVWNQGISFGLFDTNQPMMPYLFMGLSMLASMLLLIWFAVAQGRVISLALPLIIGGALGNVIDRVRFAAVADFIDAHLGDLHWPAFNIADSCIVLGAFLLAISLPGGNKTEAQAT